MQFRLTTTRTFSNLTNFKLMFFQRRFLMTIIACVYVFILKVFLNPFFFLSFNDKTVGGVVIKNDHHSKNIASNKIWSQSGASPNKSPVNSYVFQFAQKNRLSSMRTRRKKNLLFFYNIKKKKLPHLLCFHSEDCEYCNSMEKLLTKLKDEEGVKFLKLEMYENTYNYELLQELDYDNLCGGLPYYYNLKTHYNICGATTYHNLRNWALDKKCNPNEPPYEEF